MAQLYDERWMPLGHPREVNERESVFENLDARNKLLLDAGAGTLRFSLEAVKRGARQVVAIDVERDMLKRGIEKAESLTMGSKIDVILADVRHLPFLDDTFDDVIAIELFQHIPENRRLFLEETHRVLRSSGCAFVNTWNAIPRIVAGRLRLTEKGIEVRKAKSHHYYWENYYRYFFPWDFKRYMLSSSFSQIKIVGIHSMYFLPRTEMITLKEFTKASKLLRALFFLQVTVDKLFRKFNLLNQITGRTLLAILRK